MKFQEEFDRRARAVLSNKTRTHLPKDCKITVHVNTHCDPWDDMHYAESEVQVAAMGELTTDNDYKYRPLLVLHCWPRIEDFLKELDKVNP